MSTPHDPFRDFGILPDDLAPPPPVVRSALPAGQLAAQYLGTVVVAGMGLLFVFLCARRLEPPAGIAWASCLAIATALLIGYGTRHDYRWVELEGKTFRARHAYTGRLVERPVGEIRELRTMCFAVGNATTTITDALLGRVRGVLIRFHDGRDSIYVSRVDPAMSNARELIEAILYQMTREGRVITEVVDRGGKPMVRRIHREGNLGESGQAGVGPAD